MTDFNILLFDDFETLDAFGPAEIVGRLTDFYRLNYFSLLGGTVESRQKIKVHTLPVGEINASGILLIPGGMGTRTLVNDEGAISKIAELCQRSKYTLTVCTGSALLAKTGLIKNISATSNKISFEWVKSVDTDVNWQRQARWTSCGKYYTSSGVSAGMDMVLGFIADVNGINWAEKCAKEIEYIWNKDKNFDPFSIS